ncbi:MAG: glycosyltransferase family 4 protein [Candidatus Cloacimonas sp.]|jgi:glycosyltransferase involved in cell wall biosynthesis|nr:glycosyltransferase family 4 protein [Candidatus Cloacimonas sp.]
MKVLFVCSGNRGVSPIVKAQADSLIQIGISVDIFPIIGRGMLGYLKAIPKLNKHVIDTAPDIVHAHYSLCGIVSALSTRRTIVTSLMGSDVIQSGAMRWIIRFFIKHRWIKTIVKSTDMKERIDVTQLVVLPNGVNFELFKPLSKIDCKHKIGWDANRRQILFAADPNRTEKNYPLAKQACALCKVPDIELKVVHGIPQSDLPFYLNAADAVLLPSLWEGSPNIVKEAMACNVPLIATDVGDVRMLFGTIEGYYIAGQTAESLCSSMTELLEDTVVPNGRDRLKELKIDSVSIAEELNSIYLGLRD